MNTGRSTALPRALPALVTLMGALTLATQALAAQPIIHDGEYYFLKSQYGEQWAIEDNP
jgi:hypothetical protein